LGLVLLIIDFVWWWSESKEAEKEKNASRHENNTLKAKVYDLQETTKVAPKPIINPKD
jgi:hypothetical protein